MHGFKLVLFSRAFRYHHVFGLKILMKEEKMPLVMKHRVWLNLALQFRYPTDKTGFLFIGTHCSNLLQPATLACSYRISLLYLTNHKSWLLYVIHVCLGCLCINATLLGIYREQYSTIDGIPSTCGWRYREQKKSAVWGTKKTNRREEMYTPQLCVCRCIATHFCLCMGICLAEQRYWEKTSFYMQPVEFFLCVFT